MNASDQISIQISSLADWRGELLGQIRKLVLEAEHGIIEEWKWGTAVWSLHGMICSAAAFKDHVKINFFKGALLPDPARLFNAGLDAKAARSIDFHQGDRINGPALQELIRAAIVLNTSKGSNK